MKRLISLVGAILVSTSCFADISDSNLKALSSAWKGHAASQPQQIQNDITMVYGGADVSRRPTLDSRSTTA